MSIQSHWHTQALCIALALSSTAHAASAQASCGEWSSGFSAPGIAGVVQAQIVFDDGSGPALYLGGMFQAAGQAPWAGVTRWNGTTFTSVGSALTAPPFVGSVTSFAIHDDGSGPALYAGGACLSFLPTTICIGVVAKWSGSAWQLIGSSPFDAGRVDALATFDDGTGPALFAAGQSSSAGGIARWDGTQWSSVGGGLAVEPPLTFSPPFASSLAVHDDGTGAALYVGGAFNRAGGVTVASLARWDGQAWTDVGGGVRQVGGAPGGVRVLESFDDGSGRALFVAGGFDTAGAVAANGVARWNGTTWSALAGGPTCTACCPHVSGRCAIFDFAPFDDGTGPALYAASWGPIASPVNGTLRGSITRWDGTTWSDVTGDLEYATGIVDPVTNFSIVPRSGVYALQAFDDGHGARLFAGGNWLRFGGNASRSIARLDASGPAALVTGDGVGGIVDALAEFDSGSGPALYAGGNFLSVGAGATRGLARFDGTAWSPLAGGGLDDGLIRAITVYDGARGPELVVGGSFTSVGGIVANHVARWDGAAWHALAGGITSTVGAFGPPIEGVCALAVFDAGSGPELYVAGGIEAADGVVVQGIARWNGASWSGVGTGLNGTVYALCTFDDGSGNALYAAGDFAQRILRWDGVGWSSVGAPIAGIPYAMAVHDDGSGAALWLGGDVQLPGQPNRGVVRWNGVSWSSAPHLGRGVRALASFDDGSGSGPSLVAAGSFPDSASSSLPKRIARLSSGTWLPLSTGIDGRDPGLGTDDLSHETAATTLIAFGNTLTGKRDLYVGGNFALAGGKGSANFARFEACPEPGTAFCFGDGSLATACPCAAPDVVPSPSGSIGRGCASSVNAFGAELRATGTTNPDSVRLTARDLPLGSFCMFFKGDAELAAGVGIADGITCVGGAMLRFGAQNASNGVAVYPRPAVGHTVPVSVRTGTVAGSGMTGHYQVVYRDDATGFCSPATLNFTNAYRVTW